MTLAELFSKQNIEIYIFIGLIFTTGFIISAQIEKRRRSGEFYKALSGRRTQKDKILTTLIYMFAAFIFTLFWPIVLVFSIHDKINSKKYQQDQLIRKERDKFNCKPEYLIKKVTIEEVESENLIHDPLGLCPNLPFGHLNQAWLKFKDQIQENEHFWMFQISKDKELSNKSYHSRSHICGVAILKEDKVISEFIYESS